MTARTILCGASLLQLGAQRVYRGVIPACKARTPPRAAAHQTAPLSTASARDERHESLDTLRMYENPGLYDAAFPPRQFSSEVDFLLDVAKQHAGRRPLSFLELGCGPAQHSRLLAAQGLRGFAVDNSSAMLQHASSLAQQDDVSVEFLAGDIRQPCLPAGTAVDLVLMLYGTLSHLLSNSDALEAFAAAAASLTPGGVFVVEMAHPEDLFDGVMACGDAWEVEDTPFGDLVVNYGAEYNSDQLDPISQTLDRSVKVTALKDSETKVLAEGVMRQRFYTSQEVDLIGRAAGLRVVGQYGALKVPHMAPDDEEAYALVTVLQKQ